MADLRFRVTPPGNGEVALAAATERTVLQVTAPANHRLRLLGWGVFFDGQSSGAQPVVVKLARQTSAGTMTSVTPVKDDNSIAESIQSTAAYGATAEPTTGDVLARLNVHPQSGYEVIYPMGQEPIIGGGDRIAILCTAPDAVNVIPYLHLEE